MFVLQERYPLFFPLLGYVLGIFAASRFEVLSRWPWAFSILALFAVTSLYFYWKNLKVRLTLLILFSFLLGILNLGHHFFNPPPKQMQQWVKEKSKVEVEFKVKDYCRVKNGTVQAKAQLLTWFDAKSHDLTLPVLVKFKGEDCTWLPGEIYQARVRWSFPNRFQNPFSFDYPHYLKGQNILAIAWISDPTQIRFVTAQPGFLQSFLFNQRAKILKKIEFEIKDPKISGMLQALILGEEKKLDPNLEEAFRQSGLTHLLVVSGLHLSLMFLCFYFPIYTLYFLHPRWSERGFAKKLALLCALIPTFAYSVMVGMLPSVLRALCLVIFGIVAILQDWRKDFSSLILLTVFILLVFQPLWLWSLSFQFSLISVSAIYFYGRSFQSWMQFYFAEKAWFQFKLLRWMLLTLLTSFMVNLALYPILSGSFHEVSWVAPLANLILIPIFSLFLLPGTFAALFLSQLSPSVGHLLFYALEYLAKLAVGLIEFFSQIPWATSLVSPLSLFEYLAFASFMAACLMLNKPRRFAILLWLSLSFWGWQRCDSFFKSLKPQLKITMIDVGQGDSMLLELPDGQALIIDGGGIPYSSFDLGKNVLMPELMGRNQPRLAALIMTHSDADHIKGFEYLVDRMNPEEFWLSPAALESPGFATLRKKLAEKNIPLRFLTPGKKLLRASLSFEILWPSPERTAGLSDNNQSLVLRICYDQVCLLTTGDIEQEAEDALVASGMGLSSNLLKVAHHGSNTSSSSAFLAAVNPRLALISAGRDNRFGFPRSQVLARLKLQGAEILRTDLAGQIRLTTDGKKIFYETYSGLRGELGEKL